MSWFKVDDQLSRSKKVLRIPRRYRMQAMGLWALAGSWSMGELTDGFVPSHMLDELGASKAMAARLVECGLWSEVAGGFLFKSWSDFQPSSDEVRERRARDAERKREAREKKARLRAANSSNPDYQQESENVRADSSRIPSGVLTDSTRSPSGSPSGVRSTRPDPTRPDPLVKVASSADGELGAGELASMIDFVVRDRPDCRPGLTRSVEALIRSGRSVEDVRAGLDAWWRRPDAGPGLLAHLVADAQGDRQDDADTAATKAAAEAKAQAIAGCRLCDPQGWILLHEPVLPCTHTESGNEEITLQADSEPPEAPRPITSEGASRAAAALAQLRGGNDA